MTEEMRRELSPQQYIRQLFAATKDGQLEITYYPYNAEPPYARTYAMDWTEADAEEMVQRYEVLTAMLQKMGRLHNELEDAEQRKEMLTLEELSAWEIYINPFEPFEVDEAIIDELHFRAEYDSLDDEENALLERHYWWREDNSLKRLPFLRRSPSDLILRARRYEQLVALNAPEVVIREEGRWLAEEMVLYYCGPQEVQTFEEEL